jgi:hypothetical protein
MSLVSFRSILLLATIISGPPSSIVAGTWTTLDDHKEFLFELEIRNTQSTLPLTQSDLSSKHLRASCKFIAILPSSCITCPSPCLCYQTSVIVIFAETPRCGHTIASWYSKWRVSSFAALPPTAVEPRPAPDPTPRPVPQKCDRYLSLVAAIEDGFV